MHDTAKPPKFAFLRERETPTKSKKTPQKGNKEQEIICMKAEIKSLIRWIPR